MYTDKITQAIAEAAKKILEGEKLHPNQQKIDVVDDEKIDGKDFAKLRAMKKEEVERIDEISLETMKSAKSKLAQKASEYHHDDNKHWARNYAVRALDMGKKIRKKETSLKKEEVEGMVQPSFSDLLESYREAGLKGFFENFQVVQEEPTNDEYTAEVKKAQAKSEGKDKADVAKAAVQAVQSEEVELEEGYKLSAQDQRDIDAKHKRQSDQEYRDNMRERNRKESEQKKAKSSKEAWASKHADHLAAHKQRLTHARKLNRMLTSHIHNMENAKSKNAADKARPTAAHHKSLTHYLNKIMEEVEQIDEISVNTKLKYLDAAEKSRHDLNRKWDKGIATQKEKESVISREDGQARAEKSIKKKTGKYSNQLSKFDKLRYKITKEDVEQIDNED